MRPRATNFKWVNYARQDSNLQPADSKSGGTQSQPVENSTVTEPLPGACTAACTGNGKRGHGDGEIGASDGPATGGDGTSADGELAEVIAAWATLPEAVKVGILAMVRAANKGGER